MFRRQRDLERRVEYLEGVVDHLQNRPIPTGEHDDVRFEGYISSREATKALADIVAGQIGAKTRSAGSGVTGARY